jgi:hypothetical protein
VAVLTAAIVIHVCLHELPVAIIAIAAACRFCKRTHARKPE